MSHSKSFIQLLRKISLILLLIVTLIMLFHILITLFLYTNVSPWNIESSPVDAILLVFLYYVIPLISLLSFYLITNELNHFELTHATQKQGKKQAKKSGAAKQIKKANTVKQIKKKRTSTHKKKQPLQYGCYTPSAKLNKKNED